MPSKAARGRAVCSFQSLVSATSSARGWVLPGGWSCPLHTPRSLRAHVKAGRSGLVFSTPSQGWAHSPQPATSFWGEEGQHEGSGCHTPGWCVGGRIYVPWVWQGGSRDVAPPCVYRTPRLDRALPEPGQVSPTEQARDGPWFQHMISLAVSETGSQTEMSSQKCSSGTFVLFFKLAVNYLISADTS